MRVNVFSCIPGLKISIRICAHICVYACIQVCMYSTHACIHIQLYSTTYFTATCTHYLINSFLLSVEFVYLLLLHICRLQPWSWGQHPPHLCHSGRSTHIPPRHHLPPPLRTQVHGRCPHCDADVLPTQPVALTFFPQVNRQVLTT